MITRFLEMAANISSRRPQALSIRNFYQRDQAQKSISQDTVKTVIAVTVILGVIFIAFALFVIYWMYMRSVDRRERQERDKREHLSRPASGDSRDPTSSFLGPERNKGTNTGRSNPRPHKDSGRSRGKCGSVIKSSLLIMTMEQRARQGIQKRSRNPGCPAILRPRILGGPTVTR